MVRAGITKLVKAEGANMGFGTLLTRVVNLNLALANNITVVPLGTWGLVRFVIFLLREIFILLLL